MTSKEALTPIDLGFLRQYSLVFALSYDTTDVFVPTQFIVEYNTQVLTCTNCVNHFPFYSSRFWITSALPKIDTNLSFLKHSNTGNCHYTFWQFFLNLLHVHNVSIVSVIPESSANLIIAHELSECLQSAVYNVKRNGTRTVPCGAPVLVHTTADLVPFKETNWGRFVKQFKTQSTIEEERFIFLVP